MIKKQTYTDDGKKTAPKQNTSTQKPATAKQNVTVGGRSISVDVPQSKTRTPKTNVPKTNTSNVTVGGRSLSNVQKSQSYIQSKEPTQAQRLVNTARKANNTPTKQENTYQPSTEKNPFKETYSGQDYNSLMNAYTEAVEDGHYQALSANIDYKDMWSDEDKKYYDDYTKYLGDLGNKAKIAKGYAGSDQELSETNKGYTLEDIAQFDEKGNGSWIEFDKDIQTYDEEIKKLESKENELDYILSNAQYSVSADEYNNYKMQSDALKNRLDDLRTKRNDLSDKQKYQNAVIKRNNLDWLRENGTTDEYLKYVDYTGSYVNTTLEDIGLNFGASQFRKLAGLSTFVENVQKDYGEAKAKKINETITKLYKNNEVTEEEYNEVIKYAESIVAKNTSETSTGAQLNDIANQLSAMQVNGESATKKLVVDVIGNVLDNTAGQFLPATLFGRAGMTASTAVMSFAGYTSTYQQDIEQGFTHEQAMMDALFQSGIEFASELIGGERILKFAEGDILPRSFAELTLEGIKSGLAESAEEGIGWVASPLAHALATGEMPSIESWNPEELKEAVTTAFLAGFLQAEMSADLSAFGTEAPLSQTERTLSQFLRINTDEGKKRVQDFVSELNNMEPTASIRENIMLPDGTKMSERDYIGLVRNIAQREINTYESKIAVKGVEIIDSTRPNTIQSLAEDSQYSLKDVMEVARQKKIQSLNESLNASEAIQTLNEKIVEEADKRMVAENSERMAQIQERLNKDGVKISATQWDTLDDNAKANTVIVSRVSDALGGIDVEFADLRTKDGKILDGFYDNGKMVVNPNANLGAISTFIHEYTHGLESSKYYKALREEVVALYGKKAYEAELKRVIDNYSDIKELSREDAEKELTAITVQRMLGNKEFVSRLVKYHTNMAYKMYSDLKAMTTYTTVAESMARTFERAFSEQKPGMLKDAQGDVQLSFTNSRGEAITTTAEEIEGNRNLVLSMDNVAFIEKGKGVFRGITDTPLNDRVLKYYKEEYGNRIKSKKYGDILVDKKAVKNDSSHGMSNEKALAYELVPDVIEEGLITNLENQYKGKDEDRLMISAPVNIDGVDYIQTVILRQTERAKEDYVKKLYLHDITLVEKENGIKSFNNPSLGIQGHWATDASTNNISNRSEIVKSYNEAVRNNDMETAQKLVDEVAKQNGYDIKAYHGTNAKFTVFDKQKAGKNFNNYLHFGTGFYFAPTAEATKQYGKNTMSVYLSADRLLDVSKPVQNEKAYQYLIDNGMHPGDARYAMNYGDRFINALYDILLEDYSQGGANNQVQSLLREFGYDGVAGFYGVNNDQGQVVVFDPSQVKSADPVTYDDNGNVIPLSERFNSESNDIRYSKGMTADNLEGDYGYHYGAENLDYNKKSERLSSRSGRGTGAFGTGTYFFGKEGAERAKGYHFTDGRTEHKADFSNYNLYKPKNAEQGFRLHQLFKELDDNYSTQIKSKAEIKQRVSEIINELNEIEPNLNDDGSYEDLLLSPEQEEDIKNRLIELGDSEKFVEDMLDDNRNERGGSVLADYLADDLNQRYIDEDEWSSRRQPKSLDYAEDYENMESHIPELAEILGVDEGRMFDVVNEAIQSAENDTHKRDFWNGNYDSVGTRVMKALGYEGIDVRGIKELDNSSYGSVIYDLKPSSVQYSYGGPKGLDNFWLTATDEDIKKYDEAMSLRETAIQMRKEGKSEAEIRKATGWFIPDYESNKSKDRFEFYDDGTVDKLLEHVKNNNGLHSGYKQFSTIRNQPTIADIVGEDSLLLKMYPGLGKLHFVVANRKSNTGGFYSSNGKCIEINKLYPTGRSFTDAEWRNSIAHEIQHYIQEVEGFEYDHGRRNYWQKPGEIESREVGSKQANPETRDYDMFGDTIEEETYDFSTVQERSKEIADRHGWDDTSRYLDEHLQKRISDVLREELESRNYSDSNADGLLENTGDFKIFKDVDGQTFRDIFEIARAHLKFGECLDLHPLDTVDHGDWTEVGYNDTRNFLSSDGLSGFSITKDGDLISVFNLNLTKKGFLRSIAPFIKENAKTLDCYVINKEFSGSKTDLQELYNDVFGFETREVQDYNYEYDHDGIGKRYGDPQVAYMYNPNLVENTTESTETTDITPEEGEDNILTIDEGDLPVTSKTPTSEDLDRNNVAKILKEVPKTNTLSEKWDRFKRIVKHQFVDHLDAVRELSREFKRPQIIAKANYAMTSSSRAYEALLNKRFKYGTNEVIGDSLATILDSCSTEAREHLDEYMYQWRNVDTYDQGKPVFGEEVSAEDSMERIKELDEQFPELKGIAERLWEFERYNLQLYREAGMIDEQLYQWLQKNNPHYIPIQRNIDGGSGVLALDPNKALKRMKGSSRDILPMEHSMIKHTQNVYSAIAQNSLHNEIINTVGGMEELGPDAIDEALDNGFNPLGEDPQGKRLYAYRNGKKYSIPIDDDLYNSLAPVQNPFGLPNVAPVQSLTEFRRNLITGWNPMFMITNGIKDIQDAVFNTKYLKEFPRCYMEAWAQIAHKGDLYQLYISNGGRGTSYVNEVSSAKRKGNNAFVKGLNKIVSLNEAVEMAPRLAEFIATIQDGKSIEEAMYNSAEITTNFKRGGDTAKYINRNGCAFFNASIQGFDKQMRNLRDAKDGGAKGMLTYMAKMALVGGVPLAVLNGLMWDDDKDYEELSDYIKRNYYCIKKYGDGKFIRIPKGRIASFYQTVMQNGVDTLEGKVKLWEALLDDYTSLMDNVAPNNPSENFLLTPLWDAHNNKTWYGDQLVPSRLQDVPDSEQFDETTDALSIEIGKLSKKVADATGMSFLELSPYKVNYVLDQYSGGAGDIVLPMLTQKTDVGINNPVLKGLASPWLDKFTSDSVLKNKNVSNFYSLRDEVTKLANSANATDEQMLASKYLYSVASEMGKLYGEKRRIQGDTSLSNKEKYDQVREIQKQINELAKTGLANYDQANLSGRYAEIGGVSYYKNKDGNYVKPSSSALEKLNNANLSDEDKGKYFETYSSISEAREKIKADTPDGQTADYRKATIDAIQNSDMSAQAKNTLFDSFYNSKAVGHINSMELSDEQKLNLKIANKMADGTKDENGKTISNSKAKATAEAYRKLGLLEDVLKYIKDNNVAPSELGLSKTVYKELTSGSDYSTAYAKTMSKKSSKSSKKKSSTKSTVSRVRSGGTLAKAKAPQAMATNDRSIANNYFRAYANTFNNRNRTSVSQASGGSVKCPRCGNMVSSSSGRCPICGASL